MPPIRAASVRFIPSRTPAKDKSRRLWLAFFVTAAGFAHLGSDVYCIDIDADKIARLKAGEIPIYEPGLAEMVAEHRDRLHFSTNIADATDPTGERRITMYAPMRAISVLWREATRDARSSSDSRPRGRMALKASKSCFRMSTRRRGFVSWQWRRETRGSVSTMSITGPRPIVASEPFHWQHWLTVAVLSALDAIPLSTAR